MTLPPADAPTSVPGFGRRFWPVWLAGLAGIGALVLQPLPADLLARAPELQALPPPLLRLLLLVNPLLLMTLMALAGAALAHRAGLRSYLAGTAARLPAAQWSRPLLLAVLAGAALGLVLGLADRLAAPLLGAEWEAVLARAHARPVGPDLLTGVLYGGLAEEVMLRWGLMSLLLAGLLALGPRAAGSAGSAASATPVRAGLAIALAALAFAAAHLPALAASVPLSGEVVARTLALNTAAGLVYGWLFWRRGLEAAMAAHAGTHAGFALLRWLA